MPPVNEPTTTAPIWPIQQLQSQVDILARMTGAGAAKIATGLPNISAQVLLQLATLDHLNFVPAVGSPPTTSSALMPSGHPMANTSSTPIARKYSMETMQSQHFPIHHHLHHYNHFMTASNDVFATMDVRQKSPPQGVFKIAKNEPSSSSNSQPGTPSMNERRAVPACAICGTDSTGIHFGVDACAACSAFFRRTVVLNKDYACNKGGNCTVVKDGSAGQKCRSCRFRKCLNAGMDKNSVQHRRDAIGKYSAGVKRELSPDAEFESLQPPPPKTSAGYCEQPGTSSEPNGSFFSTPTTSTAFPKPRPQPNFGAGPSSVLHELICRQAFVKEQRQLFYAGCLGDWFRKPSSTENQTIHELTDFSNCMYHLWKIEPRLAADFMNRNRYLDALPIVEKLKIYRNFVIMRQSVEEPYLTWKHGGLEKRWFVMPNNTYIDFNDPAKYFSNGALKDLKLDYETTTNLFLPSFTHAMDTIGERMKRIEVTETELSVLLGLVLLDPGVYGIQESTRQYLKNIRDQLIQDVYVYYEDELTCDAEIRMADLFMIVAAIKIHSIKTSENMHMLRVFDLIPADACFNQMLDVESVNVSPDGNRDAEAEQGPTPASVPEGAREETTPTLADDE